MTKDEFIDKQSQFLRKAKIRDWLYTLVFLGILFANIPLADRIPERWNTHYLIAFFAFLFGNMYFVYWFNKWQVNSSGLFCVSCSKPMVGENAAIAIATSKCPLCGEHAFVDSNA